MRINKEADNLKLHPYVLLALACVFVHAFFSIGTKFILLPEGFLLIGVVSIAFALFYKQSIIKFASSHFIQCAFIAAVFIAVLFTFLKGKKVLFYLYVLELVVLFAIFYVLKINNKLNTTNIAILIFAASFLLRVTYILYTPYYIRQHDSGTLDLKDGHIGYIQYLLNNNFKLMNSDPTKVWQFYHPPVHHYIAAYWVKLNTFLGMEYSRAIESIQILTLFYSGCINILCYRIFKELKFRGKALLIPFALICFHPTFTLLSGSINNDILSVVFMLAAILYTIKWYNSERLSHIVIIALTVGFGMTTKLSVALITPAIAFVFLYKVIVNKNRKALMSQLVIFALICIPLGTWHSLYYYFYHGMPLGYVHKLSKQSYLYIGDYSFFERLFGFKFGHFKSLFIEFFDKYRDYNILVFILKSCVFGEWSFAKNSITSQLSILLFVSNILAILCSIASGFIYFIKNKRDNILKGFFLILYLVILVFYIRFCFVYPHICTQDFRYIVPTAVIGVIAIGYVLNEKNNRFFTSFVTLVTVFFSISSVLLFILYAN